MSPKKKGSKSMAKKQGGLGRGLDSIFIDNTTEEDKGGSAILRLSELEPRKDQPRKHFDMESLSKLADSIAANGILQPIAVRPVENGLYQIIAGERRWRAAKMAGLSEVPVIIMDIEDRKMAELSLMENIQREDLDPIEEAEAYRKLMDEYGLTQEEISSRLGRSRSTVANSLRLLDLPPEVKEMASKLQISQGHAKALLGLTDRSRIAEAAQLVVNKELSVRATEALVKAMNREAAQKPIEKKAGDGIDYAAALSEKVTQALGHRVKIHDAGKRRKIEIEYNSEADLEEIVTKLCGSGVLSSF